jgi:phasin family protein
MLHCKIYSAISTRKVFSTPAIMDRLSNIAPHHKHFQGNQMSTLPEQFSAARKTQVEAQINFFQNYAASTVENVEKIIALNLSTARASMEKSSAAVLQLLSVQDPRDLLSLTTRTQDSFDSMLAYGRELMDIATASQAALIKQAAPVVAPQAPLEPAAKPAKPLLAPVAKAAPAPAAPPVAKTKPIAKAVSKVAAVKATPAKPAAAPVPAAAAPVVITSLKAVEAAPPAAEPKQLDMLAPKAKKKK